MHIIHVHGYVMEMELMYDKKYVVTYRQCAELLSKSDHQRTPNSHLQHIKKTKL